MRTEPETSRCMLYPHLNLVKRNDPPGRGGGGGGGGVGDRQRTWCTNISPLPSAGVMNPKPFVLLNHLTVPVIFPPLWAGGY